MPDTPSSADAAAGPGLRVADAAVSQAGDGAVRSEVTASSSSPVAAQAVPSRAAGVFYTYGGGPLTSGYGSVHYAAGMVPPPSPAPVNAQPAQATDLGADPTPPEPVDDGAYAATPLADPEAYGSDAGPLDGTMGADISLDIDTEIPPVAEATEVVTAFGGDVADRHVPPVLGELPDGASEAPEPRTWHTYRSEPDPTPPEGALPVIEEPDAIDASTLTSDTGQIDNASDRAEVMDEATAMAAPTAEAIPTDAIEPQGDSNWHTYRSTTEPAAAAPIEPTAEVPDFVDISQPMPPEDSDSIAEADTVFGMFDAPLAETNSPPRMDSAAPLEEGYVVHNLAEVTDIVAASDSADPQEPAMEAEAVPATASDTPMTPTEALLGGFEFAPNTEASAALSGTAHESAQHSPQRQGFAVANLRLMIRYEEGSELAELPRLYPLPNVPPWFLGYANLQGVLVPVFDLARYLGIQAPAPEKPLLLVLSHGGNAAGVIIDGLPQRLRWSEEDRTDEGTAPSRLAPHLRGACRVGETLWFDLEAHSLLDAMEHAMSAAA